LPSEPTFIVLICLLRANDLCVHKQWEDAMIIDRRTILASAAVLPILTLPGCSATGGFSLVEAIRRLLSLSAQRAFASLLRENGFLDDQLARISLPDALGGSRGTSIVSAILGSAVFRNRLTKQVNRAAEKGAEIAAPLVVDAINTVGIEDAIGLVRGGPSAATDFLKGRMGTALVTAMIPGIDNGLKLFDSAVVTEALRAATGINFAGLRDDVTGKASDAIYRAIAREESSIRANPQATNDPLLIGVFGLIK
jgi:Protein of unknown function (DUF4197)